MFMGQRGDSMYLYMPVVHSIINFNSLHHRQMKHSRVSHANIISSRHFATHNLIQNSTDRWRRRSSHII